MLVSIIMPAYNAENVIDKAIESLESQTYSNIEILIVLDGCTDNTINICKRFMERDNRIKLIEQENQGTYFARYNGIAHAEGEYIMFLDSDDYLSQSAVQTLVEVVSRTKSDVIRFRYERIQDGKTKYFQDKYFENSDEVTIEKNQFKEKVYPMFLDGYMLSTIWANFIKKDVIPDKEDSKIVWGEDLLINLKLFDNIKNATFINSPLYKYCTNGESVTRTYNIEKLLKYLKDANYVYIKLYDYAVKWGYGEDTLQKLKKRIDYEFSTIIDKINKSGEDYTEEINKILNGWYK